MKFLENVFGSTADAALGAFVAIIVFFAGYVINGTIGLISRYLSRRTVRLQFRLQLSDLYFSLERQSKLFSSYNNSLVLGHPNYGNFKITTMPSVSIISQIGYEKAFEAFFSGLNSWVASNQKRNRGFLLVWEAVNYLEQFHSDGLREFKELDSRHSLLKAAFEDVFQKHLNLIGGIILMSNKETDVNVKSYHDGIYNIYMNFLNTGNVKNPEVIKQHLIDPLQGLANSNVQHMQKIMLSNGINDLHIATTSLNQSYKDLVDNLKASKEFAEVSTRRYAHLANNIFDSFEALLNEEPQNLLREDSWIE